MLLSKQLRGELDHIAPTMRTVRNLHTITHRHIRLIAIMTLKRTFVLQLIVSAILLCAGIQFPNTTVFGCAMAYIVCSCAGAAIMMMTMIATCEATLDAQARHYIDKHHPRPRVGSTLALIDPVQYEIVREVVRERHILMSCYIWVYKDRRWERKQLDQSAKRFSVDDLDQAADYEQQLHRQAEKTISHINVGGLLQQWVDRRVDTAGSIYTLNTAAEQRQLKQTMFETS